MRLRSKSSLGLETGENKIDIYLERWLYAPHEGLR